jgi:hypothetical protein
LRNRFLLLSFVATFVFASVRTVRSQAQAASSANKAVSVKQPFDPHDLSGTWRGDDPRPGARNFASFDQKIPEPPLTEWAKQHLLYKSISHDALDGKALPAKLRSGHICPDNQDPCYATDPNGVPTNDPNGEYPGKDCEPLAAPAIYDYPGLGSMELMTTREGDRIFQLFEYHREWRTWWLNREHPKDLDPTYEGDSTAHWDGDTLVVDTVGFNGKSMITQNVGHRKSDQFHLIERFHRVDHDHLVLDMTYSDPKAWGDKSWPGFRKYFKLVQKEDFQEFICSPREYQSYTSRVTTALDDKK